MTDHHWQARGQGHVTHFKNFGFPTFSLESVKLLKLYISCAGSYCHDTEEYYCMRDRLIPKGMSSGSRDLFKFRKISDNISETVHDRDIVAIGD